ncbi:MAG: zf-HC2 domain-containing protein [Burkholderiales bacterium]|nr:zf-HC2 domain-containing protein [Phycisphaerae bacterium]
MTCPSQQDLQQLYDGELPSDQIASVQSHVEVCPACTAALAELRMISDLVRSAPLPEPALLAIQRWQRTLSSVQERSVRRLASWMTAAASVVLAVSLYASLSNQARASAITLAEWETAVIGIDADATTSDQATAQWIATDLSRSLVGQNQSQSASPRQNEAP